MAERPDWSALHQRVGSLRSAIDNIETVQKKMLKVTGEAWSDDRLIRVVVGPRGQLVDLEIDPRVFRRPNSKALATAILATTRLAIDDANTKSQEIMAETLPAELRPTRAAGGDFRTLQNTHDADLGKGGPDDE